MTQFSHGFGFYLADALPRYRKSQADFFQGVFVAVFEPETHTDDFFLARREALQHFGRLLVQIYIERSNRTK